MSVLSVLSCAAVLGLAVVLLLGYTQLTVLSSETVELKEQLEALETENVVLTAEYERMFDLTAVRGGRGGRRHAQAQRQPDLLSGHLRRGQRRGLRKGGGRPLEAALDSLNHGVYAVVEYFQ